jgi:hypothetical protein
MNVSRGLFRAWVVISILWIIGASAMAYSIVVPQKVYGNFQAINMMKTGLVPSQFDPSKPFYSMVRSPSAEKLKVLFTHINWDTKTNFDKNAFMTKIAIGDGSTIYLPAKYNSADRAYIVDQFANQRWQRWAHAIWIIVLWAIVPCAVLFPLGYAFLWVARGFSRP